MGTEVETELRAEVAALRRTVDELNAKVMFSKIAEGEMKTKIARMVARIKEHNDAKGIMSSLRRHPLARSELSVLVCKEVLDERSPPTPPASGSKGEASSSSSSSSSSSKAGTLKDERDMFAKALAKTTRERDSFESKLKTSDAQLKKATTQVAELQAALVTLRKEVYKVGGETSFGASAVYSHRAQLARGKGFEDDQTSSHLKPEQLVLALWGVLASLAESEACRIDPDKARAQRPRRLLRSSAHGGCKEEMGGRKTPMAPHFFALCCYCLIFCTVPFCVRAYFVFVVDFFIKNNASPE